jgi:hypothetical protein
MSLDTHRAMRTDKPMPILMALEGTAPRVIDTTTDIEAARHIAQHYVASYLRTWNANGAPAPAPRFNASWNGIAVLAGGAVIIEVDE